MRGNARTTSRIAAYVASAGLAVSGLALVAPPANAVTHDPIGVDQGATWLRSQLTNGIVHNNDFGFDDLGLTVDIAMGLDAVGGQDATRDTIVDALEPRAQEYYTSTFGGVTTTYAGSLAKLLVLAQESGATPAAFGGQDLPAQLEAQVASGGVLTGRLENENDAYGDANVIGQAFAVNGLASANSGEADEAASFLLQQQCTSGYFRLNFAKKDAANQSCGEGTDSPDTDVTAIAVNQLAAAQADIPAAAAAVTRARTWLRSQQRNDGSFGGGTATEGSNSNSTGLAAQALGDTAEAENAAQWLRARQANDADRCGKLAGERGAIAYDDAALSASRADGITDATEDQWRRASAQALPAMQYLPVDTTPADPALSGPAGYLKSGSRATFTTRGVSAGDDLCLTGTGAAVRGTSPGSTWTAGVTLPAGTATRTYTVRDADGHSASAAVKVLGAKSLRVNRGTYRVKRSRYKAVQVTGLASRERARIYYRGNLVRYGTASTTGVFAARFRVGRSLGVKRITAYGQFSDIRKGAATIRVVR